MRTILRQDWAAAVHARRNVMTLGLLLIAAVLFFGFARREKLGDLDALAMQSKYTVKVAVDQIEKRWQPTDKRVARTAKIINAQWNAATLASLGASFSNEADVVDGLQQLSRWQLRGATVGYVGLTGLAMPDRATAMRTRLTVTAAQAQGHRVAYRVHDAASALSQLLPLLGLIMPWLFIVLSADIWLTTTAHASITAAMPISLAQQAQSKLLTRTALPVAATALAIVVTAAAAAVQGGVGDLSYPWPVALGTHLVTVPLWAGMLLMLGESVLLSLMLCGVMLNLNLWTKNAYVSALCASALAAIPLVWPAAARLLWFLPLAAMAPRSVILGTFQNEGGNPMLGLLGTGVVALVWTGLLIAIFARRALRVR